MGGLMGKQKKEKVTTPKLIVVFGATGAQGGAVTRAMIGDTDFNVRAVTRTPDSEKAKELKELGAEVVAADLNEVDSVKTAVANAYGVFAVTQFWENMNKETEVTQGKNIADACAEHNVRHLVFSTLENVKAAIDKDCPHFDSKAEIEEYMKQKDVGFTGVRYAFYCENILGMMKPTKGDDDVYTLGMPMQGKPLSMVVASDMGEAIHQVFKQGKKHYGKYIGLASAESTVAEYAEILNKHVEGKTFKATEMTTEEYAEMGFPGAPDLAAMFEFLQTGKAVRSVAETKKLHPGMMTFEDWVTKNKDALAALD